MSPRECELSFFREKGTSEQSVRADKGKEGEAHSIKENRWKIFLKRLRVSSAVTSSASSAIIGKRETSKRHSQ